MSRLRKLWLVARGGATAGQVISQLAIRDRNGDPIRDRNGDVVLARG